MDPNNQPQLSDNEQIMLGAQQAAMLQQIHDDEIETKVIQQQQLLNEEKILEAQQEALAMHQMVQAQDIAEHQKEADLHRLQTFAMIEQEQEMLIQQGSQPPPQLQPPGIVTMRPALPGPQATIQLGPGGPPSLTPAGLPPTAIPQTNLRPPVAQPPMLGQPPQALAQPVVFAPPPGQIPGGSEMVPMSTAPPPQLQQGPPGMAGPPGQLGLHGPSEGPSPLMMRPPLGQGPPQQAPPPIGPPASLGPVSGPPEGFPGPGRPEGFQKPEGLPGPALGMQGGPKDTFPGQGPPSSQGPPPLMNQGPPLQRMPAGPPSSQGPMPVMQGQGPQGMHGPPPGMQQQGPPPLLGAGQGPPPQMLLPPPQAGPEEQVEEEDNTEPAPKAAPSGPSGGPPRAMNTQPQVQREIKLPQALEKMLAFKDVRALQVGVKPEDVERVEKGEMFEEDIPEEQGLQVFDYETCRSLTSFPEPAEEEDEDMTAGDTQSKKESKNKRKKKKKKRARAKRAEQKLLPTLTEEQDEQVEIEYVPENLPVDRTDPNYLEFSRIFQAFKIADEDTIPDPAEEKKEAPKPVPIKARGLIDDDDSSDDDNIAAGMDDKPKLSKKKQKKLNRLSVAELKQLVTRPDVVEMHDVTARDPKLLVTLKATRNTVPVPRHWCFKRKYLQGKRGIEKPPFDLPDFIKATGIMEMRQALQEKEDQKTMKSKMRERVRPKMGKIDIDYQKLHDAFFKWQTKPKLSTHGDLYYEGKEFETRLKEKKPGNLSDELRTALGMPIGSNCNNYPPPWLIAMQRYGPPPSYPNLKIPGLNAPIPDACSFGYHAGGWGKPPVDELGKPLYGDVFGTQTTEIEAPIQDEDIDRSHWGELESESEEESDEEDESDEELEDSSGLVTPGDAGLITPSGVTSVPMGVETPDMIELRKKRIEDAMDQGGDTPALYQVIPEKKAAVGAAMMGSAHVYDISAATAGKKAPDKPGTEGVEIALNPDELDLDTAAMQAKYDQTMREQQSQLEKEDLSDMVAEHAAKQQKKRKKQQQEGKTAKKYKEFKF